MYRTTKLATALFCALSTTSIAGNELVGFHDNAKGSPLVKMLDSARNSIRIEIYEMHDATVHKAIRSALDRGVTVSIVQEPAPMEARCHIFSPKTSSDDKKCADLKSLVQEVRNSGGSYKPFNKKLCGVSGHSCFQHGKIVIVDDKLALVSTGNFNNTNLCDLDTNPEVCNRDYSVVTDDQQTITALSAIFDADLKGEKLDRNQMLSPELADKLTVSPISLERIIDFIESAKKSVRVQNQYLHEPKINKALQNKAKAGVDVQVMVSSLCWFNRPKPHEVDQATKTFTAFDEAGISTRFFTKKIQVRGKPGYLHAKAIVVDDEKAWVGSMNGSNESANMNREYGLFFDNAKWVAELTQIMDTDQADDGAETWQESLDCLKDRKP